MADVRAPRPSTDEETAPLLQNASHPDDAPAEQGEEPSYLDRLAAIVQEPLSPLTKLLLIATLVFLLLSSVFIGLFAGAQHKLNSGEGHGRSTVTVTSTATTTATTTSQATTTAVTTTTVSVPLPGPTVPPEEPVCLSPSCISLASSVLLGIDESEDPCENFYDFANGGWLKANPIPSDKGKFGHFEEIAQQNKRLLQQILSEDSSFHFSEASSLTASNPYDEQLLKKLRGLYDSCIDEDYLNEVGEAPLKEVTDKIRQLFHGKTTVVDHFEPTPEKERERLTATVAYLHSRGIGGLFSYVIDGDVGNDPNFMTLWISQPDLGLPSKEYYEEESIVDLYQSTLQRLLVTLDNEDDALLPEELTEEETHKLVVHEERLRVWPPWPWPPWGDDDDGDKDSPKENRTERAHRLAKAVIEFEKRIANASLDLDVLYQDPVATYNPVPFKIVSDSLPQFDFSTYFSAFVPRNFPSTIILTSTTYLPSLSAILNETDRDVLEAYFVTRAGLEYASYLGLDTEAWKAVRSLNEVLNGIKKGAVGDRAEYCVSQVENALGFALGRYFVRETFGGESRKVARKVITDIIGAFKQSLKKLEWMDEESAAAAAGKADALRVKVGYPLSPNTEDPRSLASYYARVKINNDTFFENILSAEISEQVRTWYQIGKQRDPLSWEMYASTVNAYFNPPANEIVFPAGILRPPFFQVDWPGYINYGSFGHVAAHELTHAFDSAGRLYNQDGKLEEWWTNTTSEGFNVRQKCIVDQYSNYTVDDGKGGKIHVNGNLTSGENIGDSGLIQAFRAWKAQYSEDTEVLLPGLNYTREQLFFISFARSWGQNIKPEAAVARVRTDPHSPNRYRVDGTVSNIPEFAAAFNCSPKAKLNPPQEKRCLFW
ncbi:metalloprotease [Dichomitus squalens LYAD-421 SS1]|uniref:metalloprotease n=1 Tax=Dichomitus squalens (strain LYAD-421) TaxID=732165 RepID=UPI0004412FE8|nr:metalloprotease [Dichomitus squalens LYAD-421 SS1]EJF65996.1 metalloprotease [Dichomitus squalens LYAD-421 SS1]